MLITFNTWLFITVFSPHILLVHGIELLTIARDKLYRAKKKLACRAKLSVNHFSFRTLYFGAFLAREGLAPNSIKLYLATVRYFQATIGFPEPQAKSSLPRLRLVQSGIGRTKAANMSTFKPRLLIACDVLLKKFDVLAACPQDYTTSFIWVACSLCFFGFFQAEEITVPAKHSLSSSQHLAWNNVAVDSTEKPTLMRVHLTGQRGGCICRMNIQ